MAATCVFGKPLADGLRKEGRKKGGGVVKEGACRGMDEGCACACICVLVILKAEANSLSFISCTRPPLTPCLFPSIYISWKLHSVWNKTLKKLLSERGRVQTSPCVFFVFSFFFFFFKDRAAWCLVAFEYGNIFCAQADLELIA